MIRKLQSRYLYQFSVIFDKSEYIIYIIYLLLVFYNISSQYDTLLLLYELLKIQRKWYDIPFLPYYLYYQKPCYYLGYYPQPIPWSNDSTSDARKAPLFTAPRPPPESDIGLCVRKDYIKEVIITDHPVSIQRQAQPPTARKPSQSDFHLTRRSSTPILVISCQRRARSPRRLSSR